MESNSNSLAKISIGINIALIVAVIILFVKMPSSSSDGIAEGSDSLKTPNHNIPDDGILRIGYFQVDSLQANILLMDEIEELLKAAQTKAEEAMAAKDREIQQWESRWNNGGTLLPSERAKYEQEAQQKQQDYMMTQQRIQAEFNQEQETYTLTLIKRITNAATDYAEANGFDYILSSQLGQNMYYGSPNFDVTNDLVRIMNADYKENAKIEEPQSVED